MPGGRPKGSTSALAARASRRNLGGGRSRKPPAGAEASVADLRERAKLDREAAQAIREQARAGREVGELCRRDEATTEVRRLAQLVRGELDRAVAYLDPGLAPEVRSAAEAAVTTAVRKLRNAISDRAENKTGAGQADPHSGKPT